MAYSHQAKAKNIKKQECIPVGCVPSAAVAILWGGLCLPGRVSASGVFAQGCLPRGYLPKGLSATPCKQNHRYLWKHYLTATTLQTVISKKEQRINDKHHINFSLLRLLSFGLNTAWQAHLRRQNLGVYSLIIWQDLLSMSELITVLSLSCASDITAVRIGVLQSNRTAHWKVDHKFFEYGCVTRGDTAQHYKDGPDLHRLHGAGRNEQPRTPSLTNRFTTTTQVELELNWRLFGAYWIHARSRDKRNK